MKARNNERVSQGMGLRSARSSSDHISIYNPSLILTESIRIEDYLAQKVPNKEVAGQPAVLQPLSEMFRLYGGTNAQTYLHIHFAFVFSLLFRGIRAVDERDRGWNRYGSIDGLDPGR
jgi:hypothetical protein